jgi:hypothetical protein
MRRKHGNTNRKRINGEKKSINSPDEVRRFDKGKIELTTFINDTTIGRVTLDPGWS